MANITITIPDEVESRFILGACKALGYSGADSPASRRQFVKAKTIGWLKNLAITGEAQAAVDASRADTTISNTPIT